MRAEDRIIRRSNLKSSVKARFSPKRRHTKKKKKIKEKIQVNKTKGRGGRKKMRNRLHASKIQMEPEAEWIKKRPSIVEQMVKRTEETKGFTGSKACDKS